MGTLRRIHRWLGALSERSKIVGLLAVIVVGVALVGGVAALVAARESDSEAAQDAYDSGLRLAQSLNDGSSRGEITSACSGTLSAARASNQGIEATYTSEQADAFYRGCGDGAPEGEAQLDATPETSTPPVEQEQPSGVTTADGAAVPAHLAAAFSQGRVLGKQVATLSQVDPALFERVATSYVDASFQSGRLALPSGATYNIPLQFDPADKSQVDAFYAGVLDAGARYFHKLAAQPEPAHKPNDTMGYTRGGRRIPYAYFENYDEGRRVGAKLANTAAAFSEYERLVKGYMMANVHWSDSSILFFFVEGAQDAWNVRKAGAPSSPGSSSKPPVEQPSSSRDDGSPLPLLPPKGSPVKVPTPQTDGGDGAPLP